MAISKRKPAVAPATVPHAKGRAAPTARRAAALAPDATPVMPEVPAVPAAAAKPPQQEAKKDKRIRSSFTLPESQIALLGELKKRCLAFGADAKKGELLSAGLRLLNDLSESALEAAVLPSMRPDRKSGTAKKRKK